MKRAVFHAPDGAVGVGIILENRFARGVTGWIVEPQGEK